jgi:hypothetical protein
MLQLYKKKPKCLVLDVNSIFDDLQYKTVLPYIEDMKNKYRAFNEILWSPVPEQPVKVVSCRTKFGDCTLAEISTSVKILVLSRIAIQHGKEICFVSGLLGDNYLTELLNICKESDLVGLYDPSGVLPQATCPGVFKLGVYFHD